MAKRKVIADREWMKAARKELGLSQTEVAEAVGCSTEFYCKIERGRQVPNVNLAIHIADFLKCDIHAFETD